MEESPFIRPTIAVIDDDADLREIYLMNLNREGFNVVSAKDGEEGLQVIRQRQPKVIILDLQMPVKNGFEVLNELAADPELHRIPVVVLSNVDDEETYQKVGKFDTRFYLVKALTTPQKTINTLREVIRQVN